MKSDWQPTKESAKQHAALQAVRVLHKLNFINDDFRPLCMGAKENPQAPSDMTTIPDTACIP